MTEPQAADAGSRPLTQAVADDVGLTFHHVGVAVRSIAKALDYYTGPFGFRQVSEPIEVPAEQVRVCFIEVDPGVRIELIEGVGDDSPVKEIAERTIGGPYHICYQVDDLDAAVKKLRKHRCRPFRRFDMPNLGRFAFLLTPDRQLFELCEPDQTTSS
jgi:methylmalonyl-CoA/ethylmalonyl-CoA epimerase